jgi:hypothetical protein
MPKSKTTMKAIWIMFLASGLTACATEEEPAQGELQQAEIIEVHGCRPGTLGNGEVCIDPLEGGGDGGGGGPTGGEGGPSDPGGGGGGGGAGSGGGGADPYPIPAPKDCTKEINHEACYSCCDWNVDKVWGERCHRIPKRNKDERRRCWEDAEQRRSACQRMCPRPIITIEVLP